MGDITDREELNLTQGCFSPDGEQRGPGGQVQADVTNSVWTSLFGGGPMGYSCAV